MRYVLLVMMSRCSFFNDQPFSTNQFASQSSSSGCVGFSPIRPKSLGVRTSAFAEVRLPDAIDDDSRRQRILRIRKPSSECQPPQTRVGWRGELGLAVCKHRGNRGRRFRSERAAHCLESADSSCRELGFV